MTEELTPEQIYAQYFDANGQPVRAGVVLTESEATEYAAFYPTETNAQTEESA